MRKPTTCAGDWSKDGRFIIFGEVNPKTINDLWILPIDGERKPYPYLRTPFTEREARFSPDAKWIAYVSDQSARPEIYAQSFPPNGVEYQMSAGGSVNPVWRGDGKELFYIAIDGKLMSVDVKIGKKLE